MRTILFVIVFGSIVLVSVPFWLIFSLLRLITPLYVLGKGLAGLAFFMLGVKIEVRGRENVDKEKNYIFMPNHLSFLDGPIIVMLIPQYVRVIVKKEVFKIPVLNYAMNKAEFISVDREGKEGGKKSIEDATEIIRKKRYSFLVFPEGTRSRNGNLQAFRRGGFFLAIDSQTPILPMVIKGSYDLMPSGSFFVKRGKVKVIFLPPISTEGYKRQNMLELMEKVERSISQKLKEIEESLKNES